MLVSVAAVFVSGSWWPQLSIGVFPLNSRTFQLSLVTMSCLVNTVNMDVRAGRRLCILGSESKPLWTNATGGCLAYHTRNTKTNENVWQQVIIIAVRQELLLPSVANYHDSVMSVVAIRCQKSNCREQLMIVVAEEERVNHCRGNIKEWTGHTLSRGILNKWHIHLNSEFLCT